MIASFIWLMSLAASASAMAIAAGSNAYAVHFAIAATLPLAIAFYATLELRNALAEQRSRAQLAAMTARYMGLIWAWAALAVSVTYATVLTWSNWAPTFLSLALGTGICLFVAGILDREAATDKPDARIINLVRLMAWGKFGLTCLAVGCLIAAGRLSPDGFGGQSRASAIHDDLI